MAFPSLSIHAAGQKKHQITNVFLLFMTETGGGKCGIHNMENIKLLL